MTLRYLTMPKWGIEMEEGKLAEWLVSEGQAFEKGQLIALIETDKITNELEADMSGVLHKVLVPEDDVRLVGELLAIFGDADESAKSVEAFLGAFNAPDTSTAAVEPAPVQSAPAVESVPIAAQPAVDNVKISPLARARAADLGLDITIITGTGPRGRISVQDVEQAAIEAGVSATAGQDDKASFTNTPTITPMSSIRKTIARRLSKAKATIPHFYLRSDVSIDSLIDMKRAFEAEQGMKISVNDLLVKAAALALVQNSDVNVQLHGDDIHSFPNADIAVAVATDSGLVTPVVKSANLRDIGDIAKTVRSMAERARSGKLTHSDMAPGTFTVSNLGMFGVDQFDAIINPPQCAILAIGAKRQVWAEQSDGAAFEGRVSVSLSCDHRAIDGAMGAKFLSSLKALIEQPDELFGC